MARTGRTQGNAAGKPTRKSPPAEKQQGAAKAAGVVGELRRAIAEAEKRGMSRADIAAAAGMTRAMVYRIADGKTMPQLDTAERILQAIGLRLQFVSTEIQ